MNSDEEALRVVTKHGLRLPQNPGTSEHNLTLEYFNGDEG